MHPEQYVDLNQVFPYYMSVHDPRRLVNPVTEGILMYGNLRYVISFTMVSNIYTYIDRATTGKILTLEPQSECLNF